VSSGQPAGRLTALQDALRCAGELTVADQMVTELAHQIGTPLNLISGYVQMMRERGVEHRPMQEWLGIVETQVVRIAAALRAMQERAHQPLARTTMSPRTPVEQACGVLRPKLERMQVTLDLHAAEPLPDIIADSTRLELALVNLLAHVLAGAAAGSRRVLALSLADSWVRLELLEADVGSAPPAALDLSNETESAGLDPCLGLSIARNIVEAHGGTIDIRRTQGHPAVLRIDLPAASPAPPAA
jgi:signal transduction histidine kinase